MSDVNEINTNTIVIEQSSQIKNQLTENSIEKPTPNNDRNLKESTQQRIFQKEIKEQTKIKKFPFNGKNSNLISKILIIGYENNILAKLIHLRLKEINKAKDSEKKKIKQNKKSRKGEENYSNEIILQNPEVLTCIVSDNSPSLDNQDIINFLFPYKPTIYQNPFHQSDDIRPRSVIFSFNIPVNNTTIAQNYFAYIYYEQKEINNQNYMCPKALCFQSSYPYFYNFKVLSKYFVQQSLNTNFDLWLYHLVYLPTPMNISYKYYFPLCELQSIDSEEREIIFNQLSGYPLFNFNLKMLFNIFKPDFILELFIWTFLEQDIIFFSEDLEILNIIMYIFANLNYPFNDSSYFFHVISVSLDTFLEGTNQYVTKTFSSMLGVNASYDESYNDYVKKNYYFIVDLEKKNIHYRKNNMEQNNEDFKTNLKLKQLLKKICKENWKIKKSSNFEIIIHNLFKDLDQISQMVTNRNLKGDQHYPPPSFLENFDFKDIKFINYIQETFYFFMIQFLSLFNKFVSLEFSNDITNQFRINFDKKIIANENTIENIFKQKFIQTSKYNSYIENFIQNYDSIDIYTIPLMFLKEFIHEYTCEKEIIIKTCHNLFSTIDNYYHIVKEAGFLINDSYQNIFLKNKKNKTFRCLYSELQLKLKDNCSINHFEKTNNEKEKTKQFFSFNHYMKEKKILYINIVNHDKINNCVPFLDNPLKEIYDKIINKQNVSRNNLIEQTANTYLEILAHQIKSINKKPKIIIHEIKEDYSSFIQGIIEEKNVKENKLSRIQIILCCFIMLFIVTRRFLNGENSLKVIPWIIKLLRLQQNTYSVRKYITMVIICCFKVIRKKKIAFEKDHLCLNKLIDLLLEFKIIPNEELMQYLNRIEGYKPCQSIFDANNIDNNQMSIDTLANNYVFLVQNNFTKHGIVKEEDIFALTSNCFYQKNIYLPNKTEDRSGNLEQGNASKNQNSKVEKNQVIEDPKTQNIQDKIINEDEKPPKTLHWQITYRQFTFIFEPLFSPLKIYNSLTSMSEASFDQSKNIDLKKLKDIFFNMVYYIQNIPNFPNEKSEKSTTKNKNKDKNSERKILKTMNNPYIKILFNWIDLIFYQ